MTQIRLSFTSKKKKIPLATSSYGLQHPHRGPYQAAGYNVVAKWCLQNTKRHGTNQCHYLPVVSLQWKKILITVHAAYIYTFIV